VNPVHLRLNSSIFIQSATIRRAAALDQVGERDGLDVFIQLVGFAAGVDDFEFIELEGLHGCAHGFRDPGSIVELAFESDAPAILEKEQIEFGVALR